ncbi:MAG: PEP-CTERM sorting domain-containing protein [Opitutales bacterium]
MILSKKYNVFLTVLLLCTSASLRGNLIFSDNFESATNSNLTNNNNVVTSTLTWYSALEDGRVRAVEDTVLGGAGNTALELTSPDTFRRMGGQFTSTTLSATEGEALELRFDMRFTESPANNIYGFRFGLYNSNGTLMTQSNPNGKNQPDEQNDDFGYYTRMASGTATATTELIREPSGNNPTGGATVTGEVILTNSGTPARIEDQLMHSFVYTLTRLSGGDLGFTVRMDGNLIGSAVDTDPLTGTFDTLYFSKGNISSDFTVDNVQLSVIPEPGTLLLMGITMGAFFLLHRRRR